MAHSDPFLEELVRVSADLDRLIADRSVGQPSQLRHDGHVDQAGELAARLRSAGRGPGRTVNPPIGRTATGGYVW
jgi:hypothetical protein